MLAFYSRAPYTGKDTCTEFAVEYLRSLGHSAERVSFADKMKIVCADALGVPRNWSDERKIAEIDKLKLDEDFGHVSYARRDDSTDPKAPVAYSVGTSGRDFIIGLAGDSSSTFGIRRLDPTFWIRHALTGVDVAYPVISDLRYLPEGDYVHHRSGYIVEVTRPGQVRKNEDDLPSVWIDGLIHNDGSLDDLRACVHSQVDALLS